MRQFFFYSTNADGVTAAVTGCAGYGGDVIIPAEIDGLRVTGIAATAFNAYTRATSLVLPEGVTSIRDSAFSFCTSLTKAKLPGSLTSIGAEAFYLCISLATIVLPNSLTNVGSAAFGQCTGLTRVATPDSLASVTDSMFEGRTGLTNVIISGGVTVLMPQAFGSCTRLSQIYFMGNAPLRDSSAFMGDDGATVYYLPGTTGWGTSFGGHPTKLWNPQIKTGGSDFGVRMNGFGYRISGTADIPIAIMASTDPAASAWLPLQTCTLTNGSIYFSDPAWTNLSPRFYRVSSP
jgi:hypothetical protein